MTLKKYWKNFFSVTIFYHKGFMLVSQTVDFLNIHENLKTYNGDQTFNSIISR
jgi:hypothetical protein